MVVLAGNLGYGAKGMELSNVNRLPHNGITPTFVHVMKVF